MPRTMKRIELDASGTPSDILIGRGQVDRVGMLAREAGHDGLTSMVLMGRTASTRYGSRVEASLRAAGYQVELRRVPPGERAKELDVATSLFRDLAAASIDRSALLVGLGGGVVMDLAGYVAANYLRGITLAQIPTTLLSQVDAAVGGKCALNVPPGKNNVGTIHHPRIVVVDPDLLASLRRGQIACGLSEAIKLAAVGNDRYLRLLESQAGRLLEGEQDAIDTAVECALEIKTGFVSRDPRGEAEQELLHFGHTLAGALEALLLPHGPTHGQAVALGMSFATHLAEIEGIAAAETGDRIRGLLGAIGLPTVLPGTHSDEILAAMRHDKKVRNGRQHFVLVRRPGEALVHDSATPDALRAALRLTQHQAAVSTGQRPTRSRRLRANAAAG